MAVTQATHIRSYLGLSSDSKPTTGVPVGSTFFETDTGSVFVYSGSAWSASPALSARARPTPLVTHRNAVTVADGTTKPAASSGLFANNPGNLTRCRVFVETTGSPTTCTLRPYLRSATNDGTNKHVGTGTLQTLAGTPNYDLCFDILANGGDVAILVETLSGGSSPAVSAYLEWS